MKTQPLIQTGQGSYTKRIYPVRRWTPEEDAIIKQHYPIGGYRGVQVAIKEAGIDFRNQSSIALRANRLGCSRRKKREKRSTEERVQQMNVDSLHNVLRGILRSAEETIKDLRSLMDRFVTTAKEIEQRAKEQ